MQPAKFLAIRQKLGLSGYEMGRALGYQGNRQTIKNQIYWYETGARPVKLWIARLMLMFDHHGVPEGWVD